MLVPTSQVLMHHSFISKMGNPSPATVHDGPAISDFEIRLCCVQSRESVIKIIPVNSKIESYGVLALDSNC